MQWCNLVSLQRKKKSFQEISITFKFFCDSILFFKSLILFIVTLFSLMASWKLKKKPKFINGNFNYTCHLI